jgi:hypothetical protein
LTFRDPASTLPRVSRSLSASWADARRDSAFWREAAATAACLAAALWSLAAFLGWVERRPGVVLPDPVLDLLPPRDLTWLAFTLIYAGLVLGVLRLAARPRRLLLAVQAYVAMILLRMAVMSVTPLEPPPGMIPLQDPLVQQFGTGKLLNKDLFFSGHTSTLFLLSLAVPGRFARALCLSCAASVGICVLWQHVHYTVDVLVAPPFAYAAYRLALRLHTEP